MPPSLQAAGALFKQIIIRMIRKGKDKMKDKTVSKGISPGKIVELILRAIVVIVSVAMIMWYIDSSFIAFGNIVGIGFFSLLILAALTWDLIAAFGRRLCKTKGGRAVVIIFWVLCALFVVYVCTAIGLMIYGSSVAPKPGSTVVVLGCQVRGDVPSLTLRNRMDAAYDYLAANPGAKAVLSGGQGDGENISEAQCMFDYLTKKGISADRLYIEDRSTTTNENIKFSKAVIEENGLDPDLAIVTDWYHEYRASVIARRAGCKSGAVSAPTANFLTAHLVTREIFALGNEILFKR